MFSHWIGNYPDATTKGASGLGKKMPGRYEGNGDFERHRLRARSSRLPRRVSVANALPACGG
jgi:hypothetical protein